MLKSTYQCEKTTFTAKPMFRNIIFSFIHHAYCFLRNMRTIFIPNWFYKLKYHMQYLVWLDFTWKVCFIKKFLFDFRSQQSWRRQNIQWLWGKDLLQKWRQIPIMFIITSKFEFQIIQIVISIVLKNSFRKCWKIECIIDLHNNMEVITDY